MAKGEKKELDTGSIKHEKWANQIEFSLSMLGYCVALGNVYRFPYLCLRNGGAAFLVPYFFFLFMIGVPLFIIDMYLGQYSGLSPVSVWNICPLFKGNAVTINLITVLISSLQGTIIAWCFVYMYHSLNMELPWSSCDNEWNSIACTEPTPVELSYSIPTNESMNYSSNDTSRNVTGSFSESELILNNSASNIVQVSASQEFFERNVLRMSPGVDDIGGITWPIVIGNLLLWVIVFLATIKGVKSIGKAVYVTTLAPYLLLGALIIRGATLPGSAQGILFYLVPDINKLFQFNVWLEALMQIFFTLGPGWGGVIMMSSHSEYKDKFIRRGILLALGCCLTSFYAGFVTFSVLGFLAHQSGQTIQQTAVAGPGLAFITYPEALAQMPLAPVWSFVFFCMLANIAIQNTFVNAKIIIDSMSDLIPRLKELQILTTGVVCAASFVMALPYSCGIGMYLLQLIDWYVFTQCTMVICLTECIIMIYCYGFENVKRDVIDMTGAAPSIWWKVTWGVTTPVCLVFMIAYTSIAMTEPTYGTYSYPQWAITSVWLLVVIVFLPIPVTMVVMFLQQKGNPLKRLKSAIRSTSSWKPQTVQYEGVNLQDESNVII